MEITLATTEDINQTLEREEELKIGNTPNKFTSYFVLNDIIPIKSKNRTRAKSERKKGMLNKRSTYENSNKYESKIANSNIKNVNDIFDLFSNTNTTISNANINSNITNNNNPKSNMFNNYYTNQNSNNKFYDLNNGNEMKNLNNDNDFNNYNNNNENEMRPMNNQNNNFNRNNNYSNNFNTNNPKNKMINLFEDNQNMNQQNNNFPNQNFNNPNEFDKYGPAPEVNSNELVNYIGNFNNGNNNNINNNDNEEINEVLIQQQEQFNDANNIFQTNNIYFSNEYNFNSNQESPKFNSKYNEDITKTDRNSETYGPYLNQYNDINAVIPTIPFIYNDNQEQEMSQTLNDIYRPNLNNIDAGLNNFGIVENNNMDNPLMYSVDKINTNFF